MKWIAFILLLSSIAVAENTQILKCKATNQGWTSLFTLDAVGIGFVKFQKLDSNQSFNCKLNVNYINDGQRSVSPNITIEFNRKECDPDLNSLEEEIFDRFTLIVDITQKEKPIGRIQWLKRRQPDICVIEKFSLFDISTNAKKWSEGTWARKTASENKKVNKK